VLVERRRDLRFTEFELRQIAAVRKELDAEYEANSHPRAGHPIRAFHSKPSVLIPQYQHHWGGRANSGCGLNDEGM
jgi:hypothetical protein